jgi:hypothetical protein
VVDAGNAHPLKICLRCKGVDWKAGHEWDCLPKNVYVRERESQNSFRKCGMRLSRESLNQDNAEIKFAQNLIDNRSSLMKHLLYQVDCELVVSA